MSRSASVRRSAMWIAIAAFALGSAIRPLTGRADERSGHVLSPSRAFVEQDGAALYANICQGCHMQDGRGAAGAGRYPALAGDANLQSADFTIAVVLDGIRAMPPFGRSLDDDQIAAVVTYVRGRFGDAREPVTAAQVHADRR